MWFALGGDASLIVGVVTVRVVTGEIRNIIRITVVFNPMLIYSIDNLPAIRYA